ncbi:MAG: SDR family NAD(P)-dependent oxidoreductase [Candidatus Alcyoniella australis]|nr:SDR family NAD(P)-dependent oxidoreductase [Candidatus Alcyoniella australis]
MQIDGKWCFISGGTSGIGLGVARWCARHGANVLIFSVDDEQVFDRARSEIEQDRRSPPQRVETLRLDVSDDEAVRRELGRAVREFGAPYLLLNSAGIGGADYFEKIDARRFEAYLRINVLGTRNVVAAVIEAMKPGAGHIVNLGSIGGLIGVFGSTAYSASKFGVVGFSECLRAELKQYGINVCVLCPGAVDTPLWRTANQSRPKEQLALNRNAGTMTADQVADALFEELPKRRFLILPGRGAKLIHLVTRLAPGLREWIADRKVRRAQQEG